VTLRVMLVVPEGQVWAGNAERVVAKTLDGDIGILTGHSPVIGVLAPGSLVQILPDGGSSGSGWVQAAVGGGFLAVADDKISILAREAVLGADVDASAVRSELGAAAGEDGDPDEKNARAVYLAAQLRAAGVEA
jgi:F-type H+-transporting ATPase subunit epsilon